MSDQNPQLMDGYENRQGMNRPDKVEETRWSYPLKMCRFMAEDMARRVEQSKASFPFPFFRGDCHSHTHHSDGAGTVAETAAMTKASGLDFQFVTDHWGVTQAPECREHGLWVGQEPVTQHHHQGILGLDHAFTPQMDFLADYRDAAALGATVFVPHPTGWWPTTVYSEEQKRVLEELPAPFLMEICNGANNIVSAFDYTDDAAIELWDYLLMLGKDIHAMGNTDAHAPHAIGMVWNNVFAEACEQDLILAALREGHSFVSDGPLVHIKLGDARMGDHAEAADRERELELTAVDSRGLACVRIVADGKELLKESLDGTEWKASIAIPQSVGRYVRLEARSYDGRRAYTNPIYLS